VTDNTVPPAGWFPDPTPGSPLLRWWTGADWSEYTKQRTIEPAPHDLRPPPGSPYTPWVWIIVAAPGLAILAYVLRANLEEIPGDVVALVLWVIMALLILVMPFLDQVSLRNRGFDRPVSGFWVFLLPPLIYLALRSRLVHRQAGRGNAPANLYVIALAAAYSTGIALFGYPDFGGQGCVPCSTAQQPAVSQPQNGPITPETTHPLIPGSGALDFHGTDAHGRTYDGVALKLASNGKETRAGYEAGVARFLLRQGFATWASCATSPATSPKPVVCIAVEAGGTPHLVQVSVLHGKARMSTFH
jgi:hypothetical protein